jgi:hypothetical protein
MTTIYEGKRWEISLGGYVTHKGTADYLKSIRAEIDPDSAEDVDSPLVDNEGRYEPPI